MTTSSKTIAIKKSENGKAKSTEKAKVEFKPKATLAETKKMLEDQITIFQQKAKLIAIVRNLKQSEKNLWITSKNKDLTLIQALIVIT